MTSSDKAMQTPNSQVYFIRSNGNSSYPPASSACLAQGTGTIHHQPLVAVTVQEQSPNLQRTCDSGSNTHQVASYRSETVGSHAFACSAYSLNKGESFVPRRRPTDCHDLALCFDPNYDATTRSCCVPPNCVPPILHHSPKP